MQSPDERRSVIPLVDTGLGNSTYLAALDEDAFVARLLASLGSYPPYFDRLGEVNRRGPALLDADRGLTPLSAAAVETLSRGGAEIIDVRPDQAYAAAHIPDALSIPLRGCSRPGWAGWCLPSDPVGDRARPRAGPGGSLLAGAQDRL